MTKAIVTLCIFSLSCFILGASTGCKKNHSPAQPKINPIDSGLKADFGFKAGSYWIYRDSISGEIDSAYVYNYSDTSTASGCINSPTRNEYITINIKLANISSAMPDHTEEWKLQEEETNRLNMRFSSNTDTLEAIQFETLTLYPFITGQFSAVVGCLLPLLMDSTEVTNIFPSYTINNLQFSNTALSLHSPRWFSSAPVHYYYTDAFYLSPNVGIIKAIFNHPVQSVHRVLELQRYHIVK